MEAFHDFSGIKLEVGGLKQELGEGDSSSSETSLVSASSALSAFLDRKRPSTCGKCERCTMTVCGRCAACRDELNQ